MRVSRSLRLPASLSPSLLSTRPAVRPGLASHLVSSPLRSQLLTDLTPCRRLPSLRRPFLTNMAAPTFTPPTDLPALPTRAPGDVHTLSSIDSFRPTHLHLDWRVDWTKKIISGSVEHTITSLKDGQKELRLDSSYLDIHSVTAISASQQELDFKVEPRKGSLGAPLVITLPQASKANDEIKIKIEYSTTSECTAIGWLAKEQTAAKTAPFLYSQCQAIHCRSLVPIFDSPWWKVTYTANVKSQYPVLMSALPVDPSNHEKFLEPETPEDAIAHPEQTRTYAFSQKVSIPSYLIAIVAGHLSFAPLGPRTGLWAEKPDLARSKWEFEEGAEKYLAALEEIVNPYSWTRYDSVVLPPSFPYGGMENANMTTLTPTLIVGDRSQCDVLLHELSHSWSGNLTSCGEWSSFWLNEGINVYLERLALQYVHGPETGPAHRGFSYIIGAKALVDARKNYADNPRFQRLVPVFKGTEDPDDAFSSIPYEAGSNLILHLERTVGGLHNFLPFIKSYFKTFHDRSVTTQDFLDHLHAFYATSAEITSALKTVDWNAWLHGEGIDLPVKMEYDDTLAKQSFALAKKWLDVVKTSADPLSAGFSADDVANFDTDQLVVFMERIHEDANVHVTDKYSRYMDDVYGFSSTKSANGEVMLRFFEVALEDSESSYKEQAAEWVSRQGRMKYNRPVYRSLYKIAPKLAQETFKAHKSFYHPIAASMIEKDLQLQSQSSNDDGTTAPPPAPSSPVIVVLGSTGTGKSQLGVEIAQHINQRSDNDNVASAEIISSDSMQVYHGLDVITNKATRGEMADVPHHLIDFLPVGKEYGLGDFVRDAQRLGEEMLERKQVPIIVGGTSYYTQHLLFPGNVVAQRSQTRRSETKQPQSSALSSALASLDATLTETWKIVQDTPPAVLPPVESTRLWSLLDALDPTMASRWHPLDGRKIANSLRVIVDTGRPCSEWIQEEGGNDADEAAVVQSACWSDKHLRLLFLWVWADKPVLDERLDARVEKMIPRGLLDEIRALRRQVAQASNLPDGAADVDYTKGIFQAIGYKEFRPFLDALDASGASSDTPLSQLPPPTQALFHKGLEEMKTATRQYAKKQIQWVQNQLMPEIRKRRAVGHDVQIAILDTGDVAQWEQNVRLPAIKAVDSFLASEGLPESLQQPEAHRRMLDPLLRNIAGDGTSAAAALSTSRLEANRQIRCEICTVAVKGRWERQRNQKQKQICAGSADAAVDDDHDAVAPPAPVYYRAADKQKHEMGKAHRSALTHHKSMQRLEEQGTLVEYGQEVQRKREERARRKEEKARLAAEAAEAEAQGQ